MSAVNLDGTQPLDPGVVGGKAWSVNHLRRLGLPVPPAFVLGVDLCRQTCELGELPVEARKALEEGIAWLEAELGRTFGSGEQPLFVSVRSGAPTSMPGMMDTVLNVGANDATLAALGGAHAADIRHRFVTQFTKVVGQAPSDVPQEQLVAAATAVFRSWDSERATTYRRNKGLGHEGGTAVTVQAMVFGNLDDNSGTGVLFTHNPVTGAAEPVGEWLPKAQGEDVVSGRLTPFSLDALKADQPDVHTQLLRAGAMLEREAGVAQDIEFTVESGRLWLLQTRAAKIASPSAAVAGCLDDWDPLHSTSDEGAYWSTGNFGEAMPGVMTPLGWTFWGPTADRATRGAFASMGALTKAEAKYPSDPRQRVANVFFGRVAGKVNFLVGIGDRLPGTTGAAVAEQVVGAMPPELTSVHTRKRYASIARRFPYSFATINRRVRAVAAETQAWWVAGIDRTAGLSRVEAVAQLLEANRRFDHVVTEHGLHVLCATQPVYDQLSKLVGPDQVTSFMSGYGTHAESAIVTDMWAASRGRLTIEEVVQRHGYHGPNEGEISGRVWREDDTGLRKLLEGYKTKPDSADPALGEARKRAEREALETRLLASLPARKRPGARIVMRLAAAIIPMRGVGKAAFLQSLDMARAAARRVGELLVDEGLLADAEDVFYLTVDEVTSLPSDAKDLVSKRRERRAYYQTLEIPPAWLGNPLATRRRVSTIDGCADGDFLEGVGASPGVVEGTVRVVGSPDDDSIEPGEILVAAATDPSWASVMFISGALIVDIGGALSHAAIVARELGIPCVVNTKTGTHQLRTGDRVRVDGAAGRIEVLSRGQ
jgi:phosphoenolpyruvate synthase/pyruvate phosphate dikinase